MRPVCWIMVLLMCGGCAMRRSPQVQAAAEPAPPPATRPTDPALLTLDQIEPAPSLKAPTTQPAGEAPLEALQLYAQARDAQLRGNRASAITLLEKALKLDPDSFELNYMLGQLSQGDASGSSSAIRALERAADIQPGNLDVHLQLGKLYLSRHESAKAVEQLRLAMLCTEYRTRPEGAALVSLYLARALQQSGYDTAALEQYRLLLSRLQHRISIRSSPELYFLLNRPEIIYIQIGELCEKRGQLEEALQNYRTAAQREPGVFDYQAHVVRALIGLKRFEEAQTLAAELVSMQRAGSASMNLLRETYKAAGREGDLSEALKGVLKKRPDDRAILFALADVLKEAGKAAEAEKLLADAVGTTDRDPLVVSRLFDFYLDAGRTEDAAKLAIETLGFKPDLLTQIEPMWNKLMRSSAGTRLRVPALQKLDVSAAAVPAKLYMVARMADAWNRDGVTRSSLEQAISIHPPFAPAYRMLLNEQLQRPDWAGQLKEQFAEKLIAQARAQGRPELAAELTGLLRLYQKRPAEAADSLNDAMRLGGRGPNTQYALATALMSDGKESQAEQLLWNMTREFPTVDEPFILLFRRRLEQQNGEGALKVLQTWLAADPFSVNARLVQADVFMQGGRMDNAEAALTALFRDEPENPNVIAALVRVYTRSARMEQLYGKLEDELSRRPENRTVGEFLIRLYGEQKRANDVRRVLETMRKAAASDPYQLYFVAHLYEQAELKQMTEQLLREVLRMEPNNAPASNDLGYMWVEEGRNLQEAEAMIRVAVAAEPDNSAYLDSLGWVLYKRGKFAEAQRYLREATEATGRPDPVVLDHLGDALYRLQREDEAAKIWQQSLDRLAETRQDREDLKNLQTQLKQKLRQHKDGQAVNVAPVVEGSSGTEARGEKPKDP